MRERCARQLHALADTLVSAQDNSSLRASGVVAMIATAENILQLSRLSSGNATLRRDWESVEEMVDAAIRRFRNRGEQRIRAQVDAGLPLLHVDAVSVLVLQSAK